jgi:methylmalonyl-CoA mutase
VKTTGLLRLILFCHPSEWKRCEPVYELSAEEIIRSIKQAEDGGADAVQLTLDVSGDTLSGARIQSQDDFRRIFEAISPDNTHIIFDTGMASPALLAMLMNNGRAARAAFLYDPFTYLARKGKRPLPQKEFQGVIRQMSGFEGIRSLCADGLFYHHAGATIVQELGVVLAIASEYLAETDEAERTSAANSLIFRISAGPLYFPEIAKFRAIRILWKNLLRTYGIDENTPPYVHTETTFQNKAEADPYNNMIRVTTEAMAAALGGVDSLTVHPYDASFQKPDQFSARIARNVHHILREEAHIAKVADPSAGSYYIEQLTNQIAAEAWTFFRSIENKGGFVKSLESGSIQDAIRASGAVKMQALRNGKRVLVGATKYRNSDEKISGKRKAVTSAVKMDVTGPKRSVQRDNLIESLQTLFEQGCTLGDVSESLIQPHEMEFSPLQPISFEELFNREEKP